MIARKMPNIPNVDRLGLGPLCAEVFRFVGGMIGAFIVIYC